jgi:WD40 repeat protein
MATLIPNTTPIRTFEDHGDRVVAVAVFRDERMVTGSYDGKLCLWDLKTGVMLKKMEGHRSRVRALAVSPDEKWIASGDESGELIAWHGRTGEPLDQVINKAHNGWIFSLHFFPDSQWLASGSSDTTVKLWSASTWQVQCRLNCGGNVRCIQHSLSSNGYNRLAIATDRNIQIYHNYDSSYGRYLAFPTQLTRTIGGGFNYSLAWTPDGKRLLSGGNGTDPTIQEWDTSTWQQVSDPWKGHFKNILALSLNSDGTLLASASLDNHVRLWRLSDRRNIAIFKHPGEILEWPTSGNAFPEDGSNDGLTKEQVTHQAQAYYNFKVLAMKSAVRNACIVGDLPTAEKVLDLDIDADANDHTAYANRAFVMGRKRDWDQALQDAFQSINIQPSLAGHVSEGIALCGKKQVLAARISFDIASMFTNGDLKTDHFLFLIKAISLFNADEHQEAMLRIGELATCPNVDPVACRIVEAYLRVQLGNIALDGARLHEAVEHFTAAVNASTFFYKLPIHLMYDEFVALFGWDLKSLWHTANQQQCYALYRAGSFRAAVESYQFIMDKTDDDMKAGFRAGFAALK